LELESRGYDWVLEEEAVEVGGRWVCKFLLAQFLTLKS
jgi:hypothetical protein